MSRTPCAVRLGHLDQPVRPNAAKARSRRERRDRLRAGGRQRTRRAFDPRFARPSAGLDRSGAGDPSWTDPSLGLFALATFGLVALVGAAVSGARFVGTGQNDALMRMAMSWALATLDYLLIAVLTLRERAAQR